MARVNEWLQEVCTIADKQTRATFYVIGAAICWGLIGLFSRQLTALQFSAVQISLLRTLVTLFSVASVLVLTNTQLLRIARRDIWLFVGSGVLSITFFNICYFISIAENTLSLAAILLYTAPFFVIVMSSIVFQERMTLRKVSALVIAFGGLLIAVGLLNADVQTSLLGLLAGLGSGFGYALYSIFSRLALRKYALLTVVFYTFLFASISLLPLGQPAAMLIAIGRSPQVVVPILALGVISTLLPFMLYTKGLQVLETGRASLLTFVEPLVATIVGAVAFAEPLTLHNALGMLLIVISLIVLNIGK